MKPAQKFAATLTAATLFYGGQLRQWTDPRNRFLEHWERADALSIVAGIVALALAFMVARSRIVSGKLERRVVNHLFVAVLGGELISTFLTYPDYKSETLYLALTAVIVWSWCHPRLQLPRRLAVGAAIFSPLTAIMAWQLWSYPEWHTPPEPPKFPQPARTASPVFVFICDEWSYTRSTEGGELLPLFKNLRAFAGGATSFDRALSPGPRTDVSIPRLLWSRTDDLIITPGQTWWPAAAGRTPTRDVPSLFADARSHGYNTALLGFYLPYRRMLGDQVDSISSFLEHPKAATFAAKLNANSLRNIAFFHDPFSRKLATRLEQSVLPNSREAFSRHWEIINRRLQRDTLGLIAQSPPNTFSFIHLPLPHCPWVFNPDGTYAGPYRGERMSHDVEGYAKHLAYLDAVLGQFLDALRRSGKYDDALIAFTSDHSWRLDYTFDGRLQDSEEVRHVPLLLKLPGQREPLRIAEKFPLLNLRPVLDAAMRGDAEATRAALPH